MGDVMSGLRRMPAQARSRQLVERVLDTASRVLMDRGIEEITTRSVAQAAKVPVASLYQYFADRDAILLALVARDTEEMDAQTREDLEALRVLSIQSMVGTIVRAFTKVYARRPEFLQIWLRGRTNSAIHDFGREHNRRMAESLRSFAIEAGVATRTLPLGVVELAVEIGDRVLQLAYEKDPSGDDFIIEEGIAMITAYLSGYATPEGLAGIDL